jgi:hypothetical protein
MLKKKRRLTEMLFSRVISRLISRILSFSHLFHLPFQAPDFFLSIVEGDLHLL